MSRRLKKIMGMGKNVEDKKDRGIALSEYAKELGVSMEGLSLSSGKFLEHELVSRIINTERSRREHRLWIVALAACIGAILSALAAWVAILKQ